jgi:hypothetical protein
MAGNRLDALVRILATVAVDQFFDETNNLKNRKEIMPIYIPRSLYAKKQPKPKSETHFKLTEFCYDEETRKFSYRPTGQLWKGAGVDAVVGPILHEGVVMKATEWLKTYGERR